MRVKEVTEAMGPGYAGNPAHAKIADLGRTLMDISAKMPMGKGVSDEEVAKSNRMSSFGDALTRFGTNFGPKSLEDVIKVSRVSPAEAKEFLELAQKTGPVQVKGNDVPDEPEDDEDFGSDDDEAAAAAADRAARRR